MSAQPASCSRRVETFCGHTTRLSHVSVSSQCAGRAPPLPVPTLRTVHPFPGPTFAPDQLVVRDAWAGNCSVMHGCGVAYGDSGDCRRHHHRSAECAHHLRPVGRRLQASVCAPETRYGLTPRGRPDAPKRSLMLCPIYNKPATKCVSEMCAPRCLGTTHFLWTCKAKFSWPLIFSKFHWPERYRTSCIDCSNTGLHDSVFF